MRKRAEFVVGGYTQSAKRVRGSVALLGQYGRPARVRRTRGLGVERSGLRELLAAFEGLCDRTRLRRRAEAARRARRMAGSSTIVQVKFAEWTEDGLLRHQLPGHPHRQRPARRATGTRIGT
ncbi:MAG: hypothetical protein ACLT98_06075 [Eggerthellaceae bacterium]